jgi:uncharacterized membrane protein
MFFQFEPTVQTTICFLKLLKVKVNKSTINDTLQNHPDWPSLLCISDALKNWNVPNGAGQVNINDIAADIDQIPTPFIAHSNDKENSLVIVTSVTNNSVTLFEKNYKKVKVKERTTFLKEWDGVYLIAEPNEYSGEPDYKKLRRKSFFRFLIPSAAFISILFASFVILYNNIQLVQLTNHRAISAIFLQYFLTLIGLFVSVLLLWYEIDNTNHFLHKVCSGIKKGNCNAILNSKAAKVFNWLSWSEVGFFYFAGALASLLFAGQNILSAVTLLSLLNLVASIYPIFSIYYQWRIAKQWCILCLLVQLVILAGLVNVIVYDFYSSVSVITFYQLMQTILFYLIPVLSWFFVKPHILKSQNDKNTKREFQRLKFNADVFKTLLKKEKQINISTEGLGIELGNRSATNTIIKVCNPYCGPCAKAHSEIEKLLMEIPNLKVQIIFTASNDPQTYLYKPVSHLLALQEKNNTRTFIQKALDDWYFQKKKDYSVFANKYPLNGELAVQGEKIEKMDRWCTSMNIQFTPTFFINGYQLPESYSIYDLKYFLFG